MAGSQPIHLSGPRIPFFLMTRFAIRPDAEILDWSVGAATAKSVLETFRDEAWLAARLELFKSVCVPSVLGQTDQSFVWIVGVASEVPRQWTQMISHASGGRSDVVVVPPGSSLSESRAERWKAREFISARLDSDDAISREYVAEIRSRIKPGHAISLFHGVQLNAGPVSLFHRFSKSNSFSALWTLDNRDVLKLPRHKDIVQEAPLRNVFTFKPHYLVFVHGKNTSRYSFRGLVVFSVKTTLARFNVGRHLTPSVRDQVALVRGTLGGLFDRCVLGFAGLARRRSGRFRSVRADQRGGHG